VDNLPSSVTSVPSTGYTRGVTNFVGVRTGVACFMLSEVIAAPCILTARKIVFAATIDAGSNFSYQQL
jgi:hypothetical protein